VVIELHGSIALRGRLTAATGAGFVTLLFNDGPGGGIGGEANELDFRNLRTSWSP
jgi:hypothetical protein